MDWICGQAVATCFIARIGEAGLSPLVRLVGDFEVAKEAAQDALQRRRRINARISRVPEFPRAAWIIEDRPRHKGYLDTIRRRKRVQ